jgi:hypothetical protein
MGTSFPGLPKRNPGLKLVNAFSVKFKLHQYQTQLDFLYIANFNKIGIDFISDNNRSQLQNHACPDWVGLRSDHRIGYPVHKQMVTINKIKGDPGECFEYFLRLF